MPETIIVSSNNPVKLEAVRLGFERVFPDRKFEVLPVSVISGVSDQPMSDAETLLGAKNRAEAARVTMPEADFWAGLEGGAESYDGRLSTFAWIYIIGPNGCGKCRTATHELPDEIGRLVASGLELGDADDLFYKRKNSKQLNGSVGLLTNDLFTRTSLYVEAVMLALIPFTNPELYRNG
ncbi:MAG TPA: inosine/xanthosine triphosphatase [Anaerolineaceae bacterium]|nr:inosine/xanthosine triphosphatase [Anaerolineaceae bacterium]